MSQPEDRNAASGMKSGFHQSLARVRSLIPAGSAVALAFVILFGMQGPSHGQARQPSPAKEQIGGASRKPGPDLKGLYNHHSSIESPINTSNVEQLKPAWTVATGENVSHTPLVDGDRIYFADWGGTVYAVNGPDGEIVWQQQVADSVKRKWPWHGFAGTGAMSKELLFEASVEGMAYGIDKQSGKVVWETDIAQDEHAGSLARMLYYDGLVYVGLQSVEELLSAMVRDFEVNFRGKVMALDADDGRVVWERWLVEKPGTGVPVWSSFALDPALNTLYFTTGNNYTGEATPLSDALIAVNAKTGAIRWHRQVTMHDVWTMADPKGPDYDFGAGPQLFEALIKGKRRKLVGAGQKSGVFYVWDRVSGERMWTVTVGHGQVGGGIHGEASIMPDRILLWGNNGFPYSNPEQHPMDIAAVDPATGKYLWVNPRAQPAVELSAGYAANDVYFVGSLDGQVRAYDTKNGERIWTSDEHSSVASSLWVDGDTVMWGTGVPKRFGGNGDPGALVAYRVAPES